MSDHDDVLSEVRGALGLITLNRPRAINALNHGMILSLTDTLAAWRSERTVERVLVRGAGDRGLCAGGDIVALHDDAKNRDFESSETFWRDEYRLNALIDRYPKPYIAFQDGIVLGGGIGISAHGSHRIVTERSKLGLPEVGIGFVPDVGAIWLLARAPGELGTYLALTAGSVTAADAIAVGLADAFVPSADLPALAESLEISDVDAAVAAASAGAGPSQLMAKREWIDSAFAADSIREILSRLRALATPEADVVVQTIASKSPIATAVTLASLRRARALGSLEDDLAQEFRVSVRSIRTHDFVEGVRAQVIDKDRTPRWDPATHESLAPEHIEAFFAPLEEAELTFPEVTAA